MSKPVFDNTEVTANSKQREVLKKHFPQCFDKHGAFMPEKLQDLVSASGSELSKESYALNWLGKSYARLLANENPRTLLSEDKAHNAKLENNASENLLIKGDNLEVLKHLVNAYSEQVKMIYIDPPYNTGSDGFVYQDDRKFTPQQLSQLAGIDSDEAKRILDFTQSKANSHSAWLTFMYPRLYLARELLKDDGVIFISIDEHEVAQLKVLCDEVFGDYNSDILVWRKNGKQGNTKKILRFKTTHEYVLVFYRDRANTRINKVKLLPNWKGEKSNVDNDSRGKWESGIVCLHEDKSDKKSANYYSIELPSGRILTREFYLSKEDFNQKVNEGRIYFPKGGDGIPRLKIFEKEEQEYFFDSIIDEMGTFSKAKEMMESILGHREIFDTPKPLKMIKEVIRSSSDKNSLVLDFFAGSGTTAHAVMQLNADDGGKRRCISVQIDEPTDRKSEAYKAGYKTIFEITKVRIEKATAKIKEENPEYKGDLGFKIFETKPLPEDYLEDIPTLSDEQQNLPLMTDDVEDMLTTWKVYDGIVLTKDLEEVDLAGYTAYQHSKVCYLMHKGFSSKALVAFLQKLDDTANTFEVEKLVVNGVNFDSKHQREIAEAITQYKNKKDKHISVEFRY